MYTNTQNNILRKGETKNILHVLVISLFVLFFFSLDTASAEASLRQIKTIEYSFGNTNNATTASAIPLFVRDSAGATSAWTTTNPTTADSGFNFQIHGSNILVQSAWIEFRAVTSGVAGSVSNIAAELSTCPGTVASCASSPVYEPLPSLGYMTNVLMYVNSAEHNVLYTKIDATAALTGFTDTQWATGIESILRLTATGGILSGHTAKLYITYESDYETAAHTEVKTVRFPLNATSTGDSGSRQTSLAAGTVQAFEYFANIPDAVADSDILDVYFELSAQGSAASTNGTWSAAIQQAGASTSPTYRVDTSLGDTLGQFVIYRPPVNTSNFQRNTQQYLAVTPGTNALQAVGGELVVTYKYSTDAAEQTETVRYMVGQTKTSNSTASSTYIINPIISNTGLSVKNVYVRAHGANNAATNLTILGDIDDSGAAASSSNTYALNFTGGEQVGTNRIIYDMSAATSSFVSGGPLKVQTRYNATGGNPIALELFVTYTWSGNQGGTQTRSVEYYTPHPQPGALTVATDVQRTMPIRLFFPEDFTRTLRSAYVETSIISSDVTTPTGVNFNINGGTTTSTGVDSISHVNTGEGMSFITITSATSTVSVASSTQVLNFNAIADQSAFFSPKAIVTYDIGFTSTGGNTGYLSGLVYADDGITLITTPVNLGIAIGTGTVSLGTATTDVDGSWSFSPESVSLISSSTPILVWFDGDVSRRGAVITKAKGTEDISGLDLYEDHLIVRHEAVTGTTTRTGDMAFYDGDNDPDIQFYASTSASVGLEVKANQRLYVWPGTYFTASGSVQINGNASPTSITDGSFHLGASSTYLAGGETRIAGNFTASSSRDYVHGEHPLVFTATTTGKFIRAASLATLGTTTFSGSGGGWTFATSATTTNLTITAGTVTGPSSHLVITGNYTNSGGTFTAGSGTTTFAGLSAKTATGTMTGTSALGNVELAEATSTWVTRTAPSDMNWTAVTYGNGTFVGVAVSSGSFQAMYSYDGITWTGANVTEASTWTAVAYGAGLFVALSSDATNKVMTSPDGITWTARSAASDSQWTSLIYAEGLFVAVAQTGEIMTSPDGITWVSRTSPSASTWYSVTYGKGLFVAVAPFGSYQSMYSYDGITWATSSFPIGEENQWQSVTYGNGLFVTVGIDGPDRVLVSSDGINWTAKVVALKEWKAVGYGNGLFVAVASSTATTAQSIMYSADGDSWSYADASSSNVWRTVVFGKDLFVVSGENTTSAIMTSPMRRTALTFGSSATMSNFTIGTSATVTAPAADLTVSGNYRNSGRFINNQGTTTLSGSSAQSITGNLTGTSAFANLAFTGSGVKSFGNANASTTGDVIIQTGSSLTAPSGLFTIGGDYTNRGTFTAGSGTTTFAGLGAHISGSLTGSNALGTVAFGLSTSDTWELAYTGAAGVESVYGIVIDHVGGVLYAATGVLGEIIRCELSTGCNESSDFTSSYDSSETMIYSITLDTTNRVIYAGTGFNANIFRCDIVATGCDADGDWTSPFDSAETNISALGFDAENGVLYAGSSNSEGVIYRCAVSTSCDASGDWSTAYDTPAGSINTFTFDTVNDVMYIGTSFGATVYRCVLSTGCDTSGDFTDYFYGGSEITIDQGNQVLYASGAYSATILRCPLSSACDADTDWSTVYTLDSTSGGVGVLGVDATHGILYIGSNTGSHVYRCRTVSGCDNTEDFSQSYGTPMTEIASFHHDSVNDVFYFGTADNALLYRRDGPVVLGSVASTTNFTVYASTTLETTAQHSVSGDYNNLGWVSASTTATTTFSGSSAQRISGNLTGSSTLPNTRFTGAGTKTFVNNASSSNFVIETGSTVVAPTLLTITGDYTNSGTFTAGGGTTTFAGTVAQTATGTMTGTSAFATLVIAGPNSTTTFGGPVTASQRFYASSSGDTLLIFAPSATATLTNATIHGSSSNEIQLRSGLDGTRWLLDLDGSYSIQYVDVKDSNACPTSGTDITATGTVNSGNTACWGFSSDPTFSSLANQTFSLNGATTSVSQMTVADHSTPSITSANDIRIKIATSTVRMKWDTTDTTAVFGGTASGKVSGTVSYEGGGSVLVIDVTSNFAGSDTLTISGLSFSQFSATNSAAVALTVYTDGASDIDVDATNDKTVTITGSLTLAEHTLGQIDNNFRFSSVSNLEIFSFRLTPSGETATVNELSLTLSGIDGVTGSDLTNARLYRDMDADGEYDASDVQVGGVGAITIDGQSGSITWSTSFAATTTRDYLVVASLDNVRPGDFMTVSLPTTNIVAVGDVIGSEIVVAGSVPSIQHIRSGGGSTQSSAVGGDAPSGDGVRGGGSNGGGGGGVDTDTGGTSLGNSAGFNAPTTHGSVQNAWTNGGSGFNSDGSYATAASTNLRHTFGGFGFSIPSGNEITGIEVKIEGSGTTAAGEIEVALSSNDGTSITSYKTTGTLTATDAIYTLGGPSDTWGTSWTPADTNNFAIEVRSQPSGNTVQIDAIRVRVYHQSTGGGGGGGGGIVFLPTENAALRLYAFLTNIGIDPRSLRLSFLTTKK